MSGFTKRAIAYWESGKRKMTLESAEKVFGVLKMRVIIERRSDDAEDRNNL